MAPTRRGLPISDLQDRVRRALAPHYTVEREISRGGMGRVFLGRDQVLDRKIAIKTLVEEFPTATAAERFRREANTLAKLEHPGIVRVYSAGVTPDGIPYYIMEYVEGPTLATRLKRGPLPLDEVYRLADDLLDAVEYAHRKGFIHRDIKPANIFLRDDRALLGDFGIARPLRAGDSSLTRPGEPIGTLGYMSPEQLAGGTASARSDLFSVGIVLEEAATGRPRRGTTDKPANSPVIAAPLVAALRRATAHQPGDRWLDAAAFRRALRRASRPEWWRTPQGLILGLVAVLAVVALVIIIWPEHCPAIDPTTPAELAILPFGSPGADEKLGTTLAKYAGLDLEWFPRWTFRPMAYTLATWEALRPNQRAKCFVPALNVRSYVDGDVLSSGSGTVLRLSFHDSSGLTLDDAEVPGKAGDLLRWSRATADTIARRVFPDRYPGWVTVRAQGGSNNPQAIREYILGEEAFHRDDLVDAEAQFRGALQRDPRFWLAAWQLALVQRWRREPFENNLELLREAHREALPELYRRLVDAQLEPNLTRRFADFEETLRRYPDNGYALLLYANEAFHRGALAGIPLDSALVLMHASAARDPYLDQAPVFDQTIWGFIALGRRGAAERDLDRRMRYTKSRHLSGSSDESSKKVAFLRLAYYERFAPVRAALVRWWLLGNPSRGMIGDLDRYTRFGLALDIPSAQAALGRILVQYGDSNSIRANGHEAQALAAMALGRPSAAFPEFDSAAAGLDAAETRMQLAEWNVVFPAIAWRGLQLPRRAQSVRDLNVLAGDPVFGTRATWALALDAYARGDTIAAAAWRDRLRMGRREARSNRWLRALLDGLAEGSRGHPAAALALTDDLISDAVTIRDTDPFVRAALYLLRGEWLLQLGRAADADRAWLWYQNSDLKGWPRGAAQAGEVDRVAGVSARLLRGDLALARGDTTTGCDMLHRVKELWADADSVLAPLRARTDSLLGHCSR